MCTCTDDYKLFSFGTPCEACTQAHAEWLAEQNRLHALDPIEVVVIGHDDITGMPIRSAMRQSEAKQYKPKPSSLTWMRVDPLVALGLATGGTIEIR